MAHALRRPAEWRVGIAGGGGLDQVVEIVREPRVLLDRALAPAAGSARALGPKRLCDLEFPEASADRRSRNPGRGFDESDAAVPARPLTRGPDASRPLRQHPPQRAVFCAEASGDPRARRYLILARINQLFRHSRLDQPAGHGGRADRRWYLGPWRSQAQAPRIRKLALLAVANVAVKVEAATAVTMTYSGFAPLSWL